MRIIVGSLVEDDGSPFKTFYKRIVLAAGKVGCKRGINAREEGADDK